MSTSTSTREKLIREAHELFYRYGFHAVGIDQIIKSVGVTKGTFYNHFASKEALILAVLEWRDGSWPSNLRATLRKHAGDRPRDQLKAFFDVLDEIWGTDRYRGCLFIRAAAEFPLPHDPIHVVAHDSVRRVGTALRELAGYAGARDPETLSRELLVLQAGAYTQSQMGDPLGAVEAGRRLARRVLAEAFHSTDGGAQNGRRSSAKTRRRTTKDRKMNAPKNRRGEKLGKLNG